MRIEIKYVVSQGNHPFDLSLDQLNKLQNAKELLIRQDHPTKSLHINGNADELELLAAALLNKAKELRRKP